MISLKRNIRVNFNPPVEFPMLFSAITPREYLERIEKTKKKMAEKNLDLLIVFSDAWRAANCRYLTGVKSYSMPTRAYFDYAPITVLTVPLDGEPTLYISLANWARRDVAGTLREKSFVKVRNLSHVKEGIEKSSASAKRIGYEGKDITPWGVYDSFHKAAGREMEDTVILEELRKVKSDSEIKLMEIASNINDRICEELVNRVIRYGVTEKEVAREIESLGHSLGAEYVDAQYMIGRHIDFGHPTDATPTDGDILSLHVILAYEGYHSDNDRIMGFGTLTDREREIATLAKKAFYNGLRAMKSGMDASEIYKAANETDPLMETHAHGIGLEGEELITELGTVDKWGKLEEGMAFTYSPVVNDKKINLEWSTEDVVVITDTGARTLTKFPIDYMIQR